MDVFDFIRNHNVIHATDLITEVELRLAERELEFSFGPQMCKYLLEYGFLIFNGAEFYGINTRTGLESRLVTMTKYMHQYFPETLPYVVVEDDDDGAFVLVDSEDNVFYFISEDNTIEELDLKLFDYMLERFEFMLELDE